MDTILASTGSSGLGAEKEMTDAEARSALGRKSAIKIQGIITVPDVIIFFGRLTQVALGQDLVVLGNFNYPVICWKSNIAGHRSSNKFLELGGNLLAQKTEEGNSVAALRWILTKQRGISGRFQSRESVRGYCNRQALTDRKMGERGGI